MSKASSRLLCRGQGRWSGWARLACRAALLALLTAPASSEALRPPPVADGGGGTMAAGRRPLRVVFLGDSITAAADWQQSFPDVAITNAGRAGDTTFDLLARLGTVRAGRPDLVLVMVGINDLLRGARVEAVAQRMTLIRQQLTESGRVRVIQQATLACEARHCGVAMVERVRQLNRLLRADVAAPDFVDVDAVLSDAAGLRPAYSLDGLHLSPAGYSRWQELLRSRLGGQLGPAVPRPERPRPVR